MTIHNRNSMILCIVGGALLITSGASGAVGIIGNFAENLSALLGLEGAATVELILGILAGLTVLGGLGVIIAGLIVTTERVEFGRILIFLSTGMGILGLVMSLVQLLMIGTLVMDLMIQVGQSLGWVGAIFSITGRTITEQPPMVK